VTRKQQRKELKSLIKNGEITRGELEIDIANENIMSDKWNESYKLYSELTLKITVWKRQLSYLDNGKCRLGSSISNIKVNKNN